MREGATPTWHWAVHRPAGERALAPRVVTAVGRHARRTRVTVDPYLSEDNSVSQMGVTDGGTQGEDVDR